jgi:hypothetical protein
MKTSSAIEQGERWTGRTGGDASEAGKVFIRPTVIADIPQIETRAGEIFGPLLAVLNRELDHALRSPAIPVRPDRGCLYQVARQLIAPCASSTWAICHINRKCTELWWTRIPSVDSIAILGRIQSSGPGYLYLFTQGKSVAEKVVSV